MVDDAKYSRMSVDLRAQTVQSMHCHPLRPYSKNDDLRIGVRYCLGQMTSLEKAKNSSLSLPSLG